MKGSKSERRPGVWRLRVYIGHDVITGKKLHASRTFTGTERQAETALARFVTEKAEGQHGGSSSMTVAELLDDFCDHSENVGKSPTTVNEYRRQTETLRAGIGRTKLAKLRVEDLDAWYDALGRRGVAVGRGGMSAASVNRYHALLKAALRLAVKRGWLKESPAERATPPTAHKPKISSPTPAELRALMAGAEAINPAHGALIAIAAITGARRGEVVALGWSDIELEACVIHIRRAIQQVGKKLTEWPTKTHGERRVNLAPAAVAVLVAYRAQVDELSESQLIPLAADPFVFSPHPSHDRPYVPTSISQMFYKVARKLGMPYHLHQLRHFAATESIAAGHDAVTVGKRLGHAKPSMTLDVYAAALEDPDRAVAETLGALVMP